MISQNKIIIVSIIIILPILCQITRKIFPYNKSNKFRYFDNFFYYSSSNNISLKDNHTQNMIQIQEYRHSRVFINTKNNKINFYITLSQRNSYDDKGIKFSFILDINNFSNATINNYSFNYSEKIINESLFFSFTQKLSNKDKKEAHLLKYISIGMNNAFNDFEASFIFDTFDLNLNLKKEKLTFRFFYLVGTFLNCILYFIVLSFFLNEKGYNLQNISITFLIIIRARLVSLIQYDLINLYEYGPPILKYLFFYFYLLIHGEILIDFNDIIALIISFIYFIMVLCMFSLLYDNDDNYLYSFENKIINGVVIQTNNSKVKNFFIRINFQFINILDVIFFYFSSNYSIIPLYIGLIIALLKHLSQREALNIKYKLFAIKFYSIGILFFALSLFFNNIIQKSIQLDDIFDKSKYIAFILVLYIILIIVIKNEIKFSFVMEDDFNKLNILNNEFCSICLNNFKNSDNGRNIFCMISELDNIHVTKCKHYFHEICLFDWRIRKNICPNCRTTLEIPKFYYFYSYFPIKLNDTMIIDLPSIIKSFLK